MNIKRYILGLFASLAFISCADFLDEEPLSKYDSDGYCTDKTSINTALNGAYDQAGNLAITGYNASKLPTDLQKRASWSQESGLGTYAITASHAYPLLLWQNNYQAIRNCNYVIESIYKLENGEEDYKVYLAQARGLRGYFYYNLIRTFGGVPLVTTVATSPNDPDIDPSRATMGETAKFIIDDLTYAAKNSRNELTDDSFQFGHFGQYTAYGFLAKFHLFMGSVCDRDDMSYLLSAKDHYKEAVDAAMIVMKSGAYKLTNYFPDAFSAHTKQTSQEEVMFAACHNDDSYTGGSVGYIYGIAGGTGVGGSSQMLVTTRYHYTFYDPTDSIRRIWNAPRGSIIGDTGSTNVYYEGYDYESTLPEGADMGDELENTSLFSFGKLRRYPVSDLASYTNGAYGMNEPILRFADILLVYAEAYNEYNGGPGTYNPSSGLSLSGPYDESLSAYDAVNLVRKRARTAAVGIIHDDETPRSYIYDNQNYVGVGSRASGTDEEGYYPHSNFMANETGVVADWRPGFYGYCYPDNGARTEDGEPRLGQTYYVNGYADDYTAFRYEILNERVRELVGEANDRWFDLTRRDMLYSACDKCAEFLNPLCGKYATSEEDATYFDPTNIKSWMIRLPIPSTEIDANSNLTQNPGY